MTTLSDLAPLVDLLWGGDVVIGPQILYAMGAHDAAPFADHHRPEDLRAKWHEAIKTASNLATELDLTGRCDIMIVEFTDGTVKPLAFKNYAELVRRTNMYEYEQLMQQQENAAQEAPAEGGDGETADAANGDAANDGEVTGEENQDAGQDGVAE